MESQPKIANSIYDSFLSALVTGNKITCKKIVKELLIDDIPLRELYVEYFQKSLYEIGSLWEHNRISVAVEHVATGIIEQLMSFVYPLLFEDTDKDKKVLVSCIANEYHQVGAKMVCDIFEMNGWDSYFIGSNIPIEDLIDMIGEKQPDIVGLSISIYFNIPVLLNTIEYIKNNFPELEIIIGGQATKFIKPAEIVKYKRTRIVNDIFELEQLIRI